MDEECPPVSIHHHSVIPYGILIMNIDITREDWCIVLRDSSHAAGECN
jgi:hypothetical protein